MHSETLNFSFIRHIKVNRHKPCTVKHLFHIKVKINCHKSRESQISYDKYEELKPCMHSDTVISILLYTRNLVKSQKIQIIQIIRKTRYFPTSLHKQP